MATKKSAKSGNQEVVPAAAENTAAVTDPPEQEASPGETVEESEEREIPAEEMDASVMTDLLEQEASSGETVEESEKQDISKDDILSNEIQVQPEEEQETPTEDIDAEPEEYRIKSERIQQKIFRITCRNKVTEMIGGVKFVDGVGYTVDAYAASWFTNKKGYEVDSIS